LSVETAIYRHLTIDHKCKKRRMVVHKHEQDNKFGAQDNKFGAQYNKFYLQDNKFDTEKKVCYFY